MFIIFYFYSFLLKRMSSDFNPSNYLLLNPELEIDDNITTVE